MDPASAWDASDLAGPPAHQEPVGFPPGSFKTVLLHDKYGSCFSGTKFGWKVGITRARMDRMSDHLSGAWVQRRYSSGCGCLFLIPWIKANNALWADQKGRCGVRRVNHVEREHFSLSGGQDSERPRPGERRILGVALCSGFIVGVQSGCRSQTLHKDLKGQRGAGLSGGCHGH